MAAFQGPTFRTGEEAALTLVVEAVADVQSCLHVYALFIVHCILLAPETLTDRIKQVPLLLVMK